MGHEVNKKLTYSCFTLQVQSYQHEASKETTVLHQFFVKETWKGNGNSVQKVDFQITWVCNYLVLWNAATTFVTQTRLVFKVVVLSIFKACGIIYACTSCKFEVFINHEIFDRTCFHCCKLIFSWRSCFICLTRFWPRIGGIFLCVCSFSKSTLGVLSALPASGSADIDYELVASLVHYITVNKPVSCQGLHELVVYFSLIAPLLYFWRDQSVIQLPQFCFRWISAVV